MTRSGLANVYGWSGFLLPIAAALLLGCALPGCNKGRAEGLRPSLLKAMVSPDRDYIAVQHRGIRNPVQVVNLTTGGLQTFPKASLLDWHPCSDGTQRLTCRRLSSTREIPKHCDLGLDGSNHALPGIPPLVTRLKWSPDGGRALYGRTVWRGQQVTQQLALWQDGVRRVVFQRAGLNPRSFSWAVDGGRVFATCSSAEGSTATGVVCVDIPSGKAVYLFEERVREVRPSADGRFLFCRAQREGDLHPPRHQLGRVATGPPYQSQVVGPPKARDIVDFDCSADGTRVATTDERGQLWYGQVDTGEYSRIADVGYKPVFLEADSLLFFRKSDTAADASVLLLYHDPRSGVTRQVAELQ